ncbi:MAG: ATP-binding protein [Casimicrobiaceae bacterium]
MTTWPTIRTVRAKVILVVLATTLTSLLVAGVALVVNERKTYDEQLITDLTAQADFIARASAPALAFDDPQSARDDLALLRARPQIVSAAIYAPNGTLFATYPADAAGLPPLPGPDGSAIHDDHVDVFQRIVDKKEILGTVFLRSRYELSGRLQAYVGILAGVLVAGLLVALAMSAWLQSTVTKPIVAVANAAREVMESRRFSLRVKRTTDDEIGYLVDSFNDMLSEIGRRQDALQLSNQTLEREMLVRRSAEQALREADQRKDEFLATLAHELRNPLAPLRNALEILRYTPSDTDTARIARAMMERQLGHMVRLVDDLLDVSRITVGKLVLKSARIDLRAVVDNAIAGTRDFIEQQRHTLTLDMPHHPLLVDGDATRLEQVVGNVLNNAAKYTDPGGQISVRVEEESAAIVMRIADNGIGIAADMLTAIFAMFAQADRALERTRAGLGVGLTLAQRLVELHGGTIEAHSEGAGRGSEFVIRLPVLRIEPAAAAPPRRAAEPLPSAGKKVLIADDNADFADSFALILDALGYTVVVAHDGEEALRLAHVERPGIAFLDIGLPKVHGFDLAQRLRSAFSAEQTTLIAVSGWGQADDRRRAFEAGFDYHFVKPVAFDQVEEVLREPLRFREKFAAEVGK